MWIVAGNASQSPSTLAVASALDHLFKLPHKPVLGPVRRLYEDCPESKKRQAGSIVFIPPTRPHDTVIAGQVALRQTSSPSAGGRSAGLTIVTSLPRVSFEPDDVQFAWAVTALAADGMSLENRRPILIDRACLRVNSVCMAIEAIGVYRSIEVMIGLFKSRGEVPPLLPGIPGDRRFEKEAIMLDQEGNSLPAGAEGKLDFGLGLGHDPAGCIEPRLAVKNVTVPPFNGVLKALTFKAGPISRVVAFCQRRL